MSDDSPGFAGFDSVTEVTTRSWGGRLFGSLVAVPIGIVLVIVAVVLLWWNEGRAVQAIRALDQGARQIVEVSSNAIDPAAEGKLVHTTGPMTAGRPAQDSVFGIGGNDLVRLRRTVEMYQWVEHKSSTTHKNLGGSETTETTYSYRKEWADKPVASSHFHAPDGHHNPSMPVSSATMNAGDVKLGAYQVDPGLVREVSGFTRFDPLASANLPGGYRRSGDYLYRGQSEADPAVGDVRVQYTAVTAQAMSVIAAANNGTLAPFRASNGYTIAMAEPGSIPASQMFREKASEERIVTWILRVVGFVVMLIGFALMGSPLSAFLGVIPLLGDIAGIGTFLIALVASTLVTALVVAVAWMAHRPVVGVAVIAVGIGVSFLLSRLRRRRPEPAHFLPPGMLPSAQDARGPKWPSKR